MHYTKLNPNSFFDNSTLSLEQTELFNKTNYFGHKLMVPEHGSYFALRQPNENKVLINDRGIIRVLSNICRHRNARMLSNRGTISSIVCPNSQMDIRLTRSFNRRSRLGKFTKNLSFSRKAYRLEWTFV